MVWWEDGGCGGNGPNNIQGNHGVEERKDKGYLGWGWGMNVD